MANTLTFVSLPQIKIDGTEISPEIYEKIDRVVVESTLYLPNMAEVHLKLPIIADPGSRNQSAFHNILEDYSRGIGKALQIGFSSDENSSKTTVFKGEVVSIEPGFNAGAAFATLIIRGYDKSHRLHNTTKTRTFLNMKDSDIATQIANDYGISPDVQSTTEVYDHIFQSALSDMEFLAERAARIGFEFFVNDEKLYFRQPTASSSTTELTFGKDLIEFNVRVSGVDQVPKVVVKGWDIQKKEPITGESTTSKTHPEIGLRKSGVDIASQFGAQEKIQVRQNVVSPNDATQIAKGILDEINSSFIEADGMAYGDPNLFAGSIVEIKEIGAVFEGKYKLTTVRHDYTEGHYNTYFTIEGRKPRNLVQLLHQGTVSPFPGVVPAIVTDIEDPQNLNRVKILYPWMDDANDSWWARVVSLGGGSGRGFFVMPEVNDEVLVAFEQGHFDKPYVIGGLFNGKDAPPANQQDAIVNGQVKKRIFQSRTGHRLELTDAEGGDNYIELIDASGNFYLRIDAQNKTVTVFSAENIELKANKDIKLEAQGKITMSAKQDVSLDGMNVKIEAKTKLDAKGTSVSVNGSATVEIKGGIVRIN